MASTKEYELVADHYDEPTNKPGEPFTYKSYRKGDKIKLDAEQAERLLAADAVKETGSEPRKRSGKPKAGEPGGETVAPKGKAEGVGDGDEDEGSIGDGGPDPQGTGSTVTDGGGGPADGQGAKTAPASSRTRKS
jgi:hypothetical protein